MRKAGVERITGETSIDIALTIEGSGTAEVSTGIGFLDHMLSQLAKHSLMNLRVQAKGDLEIDGHHTTEDTGYAVGKAVSDALGDRKGIFRYGDALIPMDETLSRVAVDLSGRPYLVWKVAFTQTRLGEMDTELFREWFQAFSQAAGCNLHVENLYGTNNHHVIESCFKGLARSLRTAMRIDPAAAGEVPSTKGILRNDASAN